MNRMERVRLRILDLLYPNLCDCCGVRIPYDMPLCANCLRELEALEIQGALWSDTHPQRATFPWAGMTVVYAYEGVARRGLLALKAGYFGLLPVASKKLAERVRAEAVGQQFDCVTFVPMEKTRRRVQGYNHSEWIARTVAKRLQLPLRGDLLAVQGGSVRQHQLGAAERKQYANRFMHRAVSLTGQTILLCDDILTTGSTLMRCTEQLLACGAAAVWIAACACRLQRLHPHAEDGGMQDVSTLNQKHL